MPSRAFRRWNNEAQAALDEIEEAHRAVGGVGPGRRYATLQVNHAYVTLLSSHFQGFCRDLHTEAVDVAIGAIIPSVLGTIVRNLLVQGRKLDTGNANPGNLGSDFGRLGMAFWPIVTSLDRRNSARHASLEALNTWRNAIAHQDWNKVGPELWLSQVQGWRSACRALATHFDAAVGTHVASLVGVAPW